MGITIVGKKGPGGRGIILPGKKNPKGGWTVFGKPFAPDVTLTAVTLDNPRLGAELSAALSAGILRVQAAFAGCDCGIGTVQLDSKVEEATPLPGGSGKFAANMINKSASRKSQIADAAARAILGALKAIIAAISKLTGLPDVASKFLGSGLVVVNEPCPSNAWPICAADREESVPIDAWLTVSFKTASGWAATIRLHLVFTVISQWLYRKRPFSGIDPGPQLGEFTVDPSDPRALTIGGRSAPGGGWADGADLDYPISADPTTQPARSDLSGPLGDLLAVSWQVGMIEGGGHPIDEFWLNAIFGVTEA